MFRAKLKVLFLHRAGHGGRGSKIMRCDQLAAMARRVHGARFEFEVDALPRPAQIRKKRRLIRRARNAIVILLKRAGGALDDDELARLSHAARGVCIDYVDAAPGGPASHIADIHIASSFAARDAIAASIAKPDFSYAAPGQEVMMLTHHPDPRIAWRPNAAPQSFAVGYFGHPANTTAPDELRRALWPDDRRQETMDSMLRRMRATPMHYAVRRKPESAHPSFKPFTKGFNAAMCNANILVNRDVDDAVAYLGADYPFLIPSNDPKDVRDGVERARASYGGAIWREGLDRMAAMRRACAEDRIMSEFGAILER
ncbi:MAG: hypothetical protein AAF360_10100, partial [Pseudomonadota bacterium]